MYDSDLVEMNCQFSSIEAIWQETKKLSIEEKAELVEKLLGKESGLMVVSKSSHLADYIIAQMSLLSREGLAYVLRSIEERISTEFSSSRR
ncbi:MAG TPA: hypothetical protein V6D33_07950 [Cyanophyceae cyanobacterium]